MIPTIRNGTTSLQETHSRRFAITYIASRRAFSSVLKFFTQEQFRGPSAQ